MVWTKRRPWPFDSSLSFRGQSKASQAVASRPWQRLAVAPCHFSHPMRKMDTIVCPCAESREWDIIKREIETESKSKQQFQSANTQTERVSVNKRQRHSTNHKEEQAQMLYVPNALHPPQPPVLFHLYYILSIHSLSFVIL